jgi:predicted DNA-binding protein
MAKAEDDRYARSIRFPPELWSAIDEDAERCRRTSSNAHLEAILLDYYQLGDVRLKDPSSTREAIAEEARRKLREEKSSLAKAKKGRLKIGNG